MPIQQEKSQITRTETRTVGRIRDILEEVSANPEDYDLLKSSVEIYELVLQSLRVCPDCGTDLAVEREVFGNDKLFTGHRCRGTNNNKEL